MCVCVVEGVLCSVLVFGSRSVGRVPLMVRMVGLIGLGPKG